MLFKTHLASLVLVPLIGIQLSIPMTQPQDIEVPKELTPKEYIIKYAQEYGVSEKLLLKVAECESELDINAINNDEPNGIQSLGIYQIQPPTWEYFEKKFNVDLDPNIPEDNIKMAAIAFSKNEGLNWTSYRAIKNGGTYTFVSSKNGKKYTVYCKL